MEALDILRSLLDETERERVEPELAEELHESPWNPASDDDMVRWAESEIVSHQGDRLKLAEVPTVRAIWLYFVQCFRDGVAIRAAILGPRGGGKTFLAAALQVLAARWYGGSTTNLGGSKEQAARCYAHITRTVQTIPGAAYPGFSGDVSQHVLSSILSKTVFVDRAEIEVLAASMKSVRGAHPKGPKGLGVIVIDEAALVEDSVVDAAKKQVVTADPSAIVQLSTMGELQTGSWWKLTRNPKKAGYRMFRYDIFDVAARCPYDCETSCPVKEHFAEDYYEDLGGGRRKFVHKAYCGGKAHEVDGHVTVDEIKRQWDDSDRLSFERELMGWSSENVGAVYDGDLIDKAIADDVWLDRGRDPDQHWRRFLLCDKAAGMDWGFSSPSQTAIAWGLRFRDKIIVYRWQFWSGERYSTIRGIVAETCFEERVATVRPDGAQASDNDELAALVSEGNDHYRELARAGFDRVTKAHKNGAGAGPQELRTFLGHALEDDEEPDAWDVAVEPVNFGTEKTYGIGEVRRRLEHGTIVFAKRFGGEPVPNHERAMEYLRAYHYDENGKPVKRDDHGPDGLLCLCLTWAPRRIGQSVGIS